jgi:hypothetical protein
MGRTSVLPSSQTFGSVTLLRTGIYNRLDIYITERLYELRECMSVRCGIRYSISDRLAVRSLVGITDPIGSQRRILP